VAYEFKLPDLGEGLTEAEIARWLVAEGQAVEEDDPLVEIQTDKTTVEIPSPAAGKVATEQSYIGELTDGTRNDMHNCNFFDFDAEGKFRRVIIWMAGTNPLH